MKNLNNFKNSEIAKTQAGKITGGIAHILCPRMAADLQAAQAVGDTETVNRIRRDMDELGCPPC